MPEGLATRRTGEGPITRPLAQALPIQWKTLLLQRNEETAQVGGKFHSDPRPSQFKNDSLFVLEPHTADPPDKRAAASDCTVSPAKVAHVAQPRGPALQAANRCARCNAQA